MSASTITPKQQSFIRSLLTERQSVLGIDDIDAYIRDKGINRLTGQSASAVIEKLLAIPKPDNPEHAHLPKGRTIVNRYSKPCALCKGSVESQTGWCVQLASGWQTYHAFGACGAPAPESVPAPAVHENLIEVEAKRAYRCEDGTIAIAYTTQNGYLAMRRLVIEDGVGGLEYWKGGVNIVRATGTLLTQEEASSLGKTYGFCVCCGRDLSEDTSLAVGYGATCAGNNGWWYPTTKEAREILNRSVPA
jgi:hypothetical protein